MPHVIVKLWPGKTDRQKAELTKAIIDNVTRVLGNDEESVSVGFEEVPASEWFVAVYDPDIRDKWDTLTKQPGYRPPH